MDPHRMPLAELKKAMQQAQEPPQMSPVQQQLKQTFAEFRQLCPDYADTPENARALANYLTRETPTVDELITAHALARYQNRYTPNAPVLDTNPNTMPLEQLKNVAEGRPQVAEHDDLKDMPMHELKNLVEGRPQRSESYEEYSMPMEDLRHLKDGAPVPGNEQSPVSVSLFRSDESGGLNPKEGI
ncbi:MAG TPA: hypothetical protein VN577_08965 [Terriglobales bacterium]|nr:hypothetical protein [Terriglobales bacterium]